MDPARARPSAKPSSGTPDAPDGNQIIIGLPGGDPGSNVPTSITFGSVEIHGRGASKQEAKQNLASGERALAGIKKALSRPGIKLQRPKKVPFFYVDSAKPSVLVRVVDGTTTRGTFVNGKFKPER